MASVIQKVYLARGLTVLIDFEKHPELIVTSGTEKFIIHERNGCPMVAWGSTPFFKEKNEKEEKENCK